MLKYLIISCQTKPLTVNCSDEKPSLLSSGGLLNREDVVAAGTGVPLPNIGAEQKQCHNYGQFIFKNLFNQIYKPFLFSYSCFQLGYSNGNTEEEPYIIFNPKFFFSKMQPFA